MNNEHEQRDGSGVHANTNKRNFIIITIAIFAAFTIFGFTENVRGPTLPRIQADFGISEFQLGMLIAGNSLGYLIGCSYTAGLAKKIGIKNSLITALIAIALCGVSVFYAQNFVILLLSFFAISLGYGMIEITLGVIAATTFKKRLGTMLNLSHFFYGMGAMFAPLATIGIMTMRFGSQTLSWRYAYLIILSTAIVPLIPLIIGRIKKQDYNKKKTGYASMLKRPTIWLIVAVLALGVLTELGTAAWLVMYLERSQSLTGENAALGLTLFFAGFTLTRLFIGPLTDKIGFVNTLIIVAAFAGCTLIFGTLLGSTGIPIVVATGIGVAPIYPTVMALVAKLFQDEIDTAITVVATATGMFMVIANLSLGGIINQMRVIFTQLHGEAGIGIAHAGGMIFLGACGFASCIAAILLRRKLKKNGQLV